MKSGDGEKTRPEQLIEHIARYGLTLRAVAGRLFCDGSASKTENLFAKLLEQKRIVAFSLSKAPRLSYYRLSEKESARLGLTPTAGRLSGRTALQAIALLRFCFPGAQPVKRAKISAATVSSKLGFPFKSLDASYVVQRHPEQYFGRVVVPGPQARPEYALKIIRLETMYWLRFPEAEHWLSTGALRFVVLLHSPPRVVQFTEALAAARERKTLPAEVRIDLEYVPDPLAAQPAAKPRARTATP